MMFYSISIISLLLYCMYLRTSYFYALLLAYTFFFYLGCLLASIEDPLVGGPTVY